MFQAIQIEAQGFRRIVARGGVFDELGLVRRSGGHVHGDRKTMAVTNRQDFAALTASSEAHGRAPFSRN
jgi:hypothetical protein